MCIPYGDFKTAMGIFYRYTSPDGDCQHEVINSRRLTNTK